MLRVNADVVVLPTASSKEPDATVMTAVPPDDRDDVNVAVYEVPLPENPVSDPRVADTSAEVKLVVDSLTVNVTVVVAPEVTEVGLAVMVTVGAVVSIVMELEDADDTLFDASTA